jgi:fused signal recognition particle receptor
MVLKAALDAIRRGLARTRDAIGGGLRSLLLGRTLDPALLDQVERTLVAADVGVKAAREISDGLREEFRSGRVSRGEDAMEWLKRSIKARLARPEGEAGGIRFAKGRPTVVLVVGVNGVGKTTSVAKIARSIRDTGRTVLLAAADTFRAGAVAQLETWSQRLGVDIVKGAPGADPAAVAFDATSAALARGVDVLLVDTAGRLHTQDSLMRQLVKIRDVIRKRIPDAPHETLLVLDATSGQNAIAQAKAFSAAVDISGIFLSKLDGTAKGGVVIAIRDALDVPVKLVGLGERPEDVEPFDADRFVDAVFAVDGNAAPLG